jgi:hypothetical protein
MATVDSASLNVGDWPKAAIIGIRLERQLSGDKLPSLGTARDGRR